MDTQLLKDKILSGKLSEEDFEQLLGKAGQQDKGGFLSMVKYLIDAYNGPRIWKLVMETVLIVVAISGILLLSFSGKIDGTVTSVLIAFSLGFLFGRIR